MSARRAVLILAPVLPLAVNAQPAPAPATGGAQTFVFDDHSNRDTVAFTLDAPLEVINGVSVVLPCWLHAEKTPEIIIEFKDVELPAPLEQGKPLKVQTKGTFTMRGQTREEPVEVTAVYFKESAETRNRARGDLLRVRAKFRIPLEAYGIKRTEALILKVGEVAEISVDAWGSTQFKL